MLSDIHNLPSIKETIWCTQKAMAVLFDVGIPAISKHLTNVFETGELKQLVSEFPLPFACVPWGHHVRIVQHSISDAF